MPDMPWTPPRAARDTEPTAPRPPEQAIYVCCLAELQVHARALRPSHLASLVSAYEQPPTPPEVRSERHLRLEFDDIDVPILGYVVPEREHVGQLIAFARGWTGDRPMLIHCAAGISRSTAAALVAAACRSAADERQLARALREAAPHAKPNRRIVELADDLLGREGRLVAAINEMGPAELCLQGPLVRLPVPSFP